MTKRIVAALLFLLADQLKKAGSWCARKSLRLMGFNTDTPAMLAGGCLACGSMFAVQAEFEAHRCPRRAS